MNIFKKGYDDIHFIKYHYSWFRTSHIKKYIDILTSIINNYIRDKSSKEYYSEVYKLEQILKEDINYLKIGCTIDMEKLEFEYTI